MVIDKMNQDIRKLQDAKGVVDAQIVAQKKETEAAVKTLSVSLSGCGIWSDLQQFFASSGYDIDVYKVLHCLKDIFF